MEIIEQYFPELSLSQRRQFEQLAELYKYWNQQINVISRQDIENLYEHHVLHSLAIAKFIQFRKGTEIIDVGTGGGFPGIPLAIFFPECSFYLVEAKRKKIKVVNGIAQALHLHNIFAEPVRSEQVNKRFDFVVCRAVSKLPKFVNLVQKNLRRGNQNALPNGIIYLKGGNLSEEIEPFKKTITIEKISNYFSEAFFETKKIVYLPF